MSVQEIIPTRDSKLRIHDFEEVATGYTEDMAQKEAKRCLQCKNPQCVKGCPVEIDIPVFIKNITDGNYADAINIIREKNSLPAVCGRVCPQENQCELKCILNSKNIPISIGDLERFVADWEQKHSSKWNISNAEKSQKTKKIAIIGSGPASLTCAGDCAKNGYDVTIFEALHAAGGVLRYGIPDFRLPSNIIDYELDYIKSLGVKLEVNVVIGITKTIEDLKNDGFEAFFIGTGAGLPHFLNIPNEHLNGIYSSNEFLTRINLMKAYRFPEYDTPIKVGKNAIVIGGGNVAMDASRALIRLGVPSVSILYRRTVEDMPARKEEIKHAEEEGVKFLTLASPLSFISDEKGNVREIEAQKMKRCSTCGKDGRYSVEPIPNEIFNLEIDTVIIAIGQKAHPLLTRNIPELSLNAHNYITVNPDTMETNLKGIFAGGDIVTGADTVISAMGAGKKAAKSIDGFLSLPILS